MPYHVESPCSQCPSSQLHGVVNSQTGKVVPGGCHATKQQAQKHMAALYANVPDAAAGGVEMDVEQASRTGCGCTGRDRVGRLRAVSEFVHKYNRHGLDRATRIARELARMALRQQVQGDLDWDDDPGHLVQALDAVLDEALEAFQAGENDQGIDLVVAAAATVDQALAVMGLDDSDEPEEPGEPPEQPMGGGMMNSSRSAVAPAHLVGRAAVDNGAWDAQAAMSNCVSSSTPATCFGSICAGRRAGPADQEASWALPHHARPGAPPNHNGVQAALGRLDGTQGLTNKAAARAHLEAHMRAIGSSSGAGRDGLASQHAGRRHGPMPREGLVRGVFATAIRDGTWDGTGEPAQDPPTLFGHFALFNEWTEIDSFWEGHFMESLASGCFDSTIEKNGANIRCLFQHGRDPIVGSKVLGPIRTIQPDERGVYYEVPLYDTSWNRDLLPGLTDNQYGASFRFRVLREEISEEPGVSDWNPAGIPERKVTELELMEFGPVTFPQYVGADAGMRSRSGVRSLTDDVILLSVGYGSDRMEEFVAHWLRHQYAGVPPQSRSAEEDRPAEGAVKPARSLVVTRNPNRAQ